MPGLCPTRQLIKTSKDSELDISHKQSVDQYLNTMLKFPTGTTERAGRYGQRRVIGSGRS